MYFLEDQSAAAFIDPVILASLALAVAAILYAVRLRRRLRAHPRRAAGYHVLRLDLNSALLAWGVAQVGVVLGWALRLEGLRMPAWSYLGLLIGAAIAVVAWRKDHDRAWSADARAEGGDELTDAGTRQVRSETWEFGILGAAVIGLVTYMVSVGHAFPHPLHWVISGLGMLAGYGLGIAVWTPRAKVLVRAPTASRATKHSSAQASRR